MDVTADDFRRHYAELSDEALLEINPGELVAVARTCLGEEVARRGLNTASGDPVAEEPGSVPAAEPKDERVCIVEYDHRDEADIAQGLLEAAEIPASVESEPGVSRLLVPPEFAEQALSLLAAPLSDEELAAQAEAAGHAEGSLE